MAEKELNTDRLILTIKAWEKQRIWFNVSVGIAGIYSIIPYWDDFTYRLFWNITGVLIWGLLANILYSTGILLEIIDSYYFKGKVNFYRFRHLFWVLGTLMYCLLTLAYTNAYLSNIVVW